MSEVKIIIALILAVALSVGLSLFGSHYLALKEASALSQTRGQVLGSATAGIKQGEAIDKVQEAYNQGIADARAAFQHSKDEAISHEPETAARAVRDVPVSVRNAYAERRRARERLGCTARECRKDN